VLRFCSKDSAGHPAISQAHGDGPADGRVGPGILVKKMGKPMKN